jgi:hypothetical protein
MTDTTEDAEALPATEDEQRGEQRLSISAIADMLSRPEALVRRMLYRGEIATTKRADVEAWIKSQEPNTITMLPHGRHDRVFNKWRD